MNSFFRIAISLVLLFALDCVSEEPQAQPSSMPLDQAIKEAANQINEQMEAGTKIAFSNFDSPSEKLSSYVLNELTANLVDSKKLAIVDRNVPEAQAIVSGSLTELGDLYRIAILVSNVQNSTIVMQYRTDIVKDARVQALLPAEKPSQAAAPAAKDPFPKLGKWNITGLDASDWAGSVMVIEEIDGEKFNGYFDWYTGKKYIGKEHFRGTYTAQQKSILMKGYRLTNAKKGTVMGTYRARIAKNGYDIESGVWGGDGVVTEGTWEAKLQK